jgi:hypothetical protein
METVLLQLFNWLWTGEVMPTAWSQGVIVNLQSWRHSAARQLPITLSRSAARCSRTSCGSAWKRRWPCTKRRPRSDRSSCADQQFVLPELDRRLVRLERRCTRSFDLRKAYDTVWRDGLFYKLLKKGVDGKLYESCGICSQRRVHECSERSAVGCLPRSWTRDPFDAAFDIYIDDLLDCLHECATEDAVALGEALIAALAYADDVAAVSFSPEGLQRHIDTVVAWLRKWRMAANTVKSQTMIIHPKANESASVAPEDRAHCWTLDGWSSTRYKNTSIWDLVPGGWRVGPPC